MKSKIFQIAGDASFRKFYRIILKKKRKILIFSEKEKYQNLVAYSAINKFLRENKILTPKLYAKDLLKGIIVIEDFGSQLFYNLLLKKKNQFEIYKKIVDLLLKIQKIKPKKKIKSIIKKPHVISTYSKKNLHKESDLFFDWYLPLYLNKNKAFSIKKKTKLILNQLYKNIYFPNSYFVHRDFHSQNLIKVKKRIGVIDSQDAIIGNPAYDLVSLIDDVRIKTSNKLKNKIYSYYLKKASKVYNFDSEKFLQDFNILSVQRSLKIIGIFSRLYKRDKKKMYLKLIPYTWQILEMRMKSKIFHKLRKILDENISRTIRKKTIPK